MQSKCIRKTYNKHYIDGYKIIDTSCNNKNKKRKT